MKDKKLLLIMLIFSILVFLVWFINSMLIDKFIRENQIDAWEYCPGAGHASTLDDVSSLSWKRDDKLPGNPKDIGSVLWLRFRISEKNAGKIIWSDRIYTACDAYIGNSNVFSFGVDGKDPLKNFSGFTHLMVDTEKKSAGKYFYVKVYSVYNYYSGLGGNTLILSENDLLSFQFRQNIIPIVCSFSLMLFSILCFLFLLLKLTIPGIGQLALANFLIGIYTLRYTTACLFLFNSPIFWSITGMIVIFAIPYFLLKVIQAIYNTRNILPLKFWSILNIVFLLLGSLATIITAIVANTQYAKLFINGLLILRMIFLIVTIVSAFAIVIFLITEYRKKNRNSGFLLLGISNLFIFSIPDILPAFGISMIKFRSSVYIGLFMFVVSFLLVMLRRYGRYNAVYKSTRQLLAFHPNDFFYKLFQDYNLSNREREVLAEIFKGNSNKTVADQLFISERTIKNHMNNIFLKFNVKNKMELFYCILIGNE